MFTKTHAKVLGSMLKERDKSEQYLASSGVPMFKGSHRARLLKEASAIRAALAALAPNQGETT